MISNRTKIAMGLFHIRPGTKNSAKLSQDPIVRESLMPIENLDHYFIYSSDLEKSRKFYSQILGLTDGPRPNFDFEGHWFYLNDTPVVHIGTTRFPGGIPAVNADAIVDNLPKQGTGRIDHVAFKATNVAEFIERLEKGSLPYHKQLIPEFNLTQLFVKDPDGATIELNFFAAST
jgi:catechol 2,3-dioxygenase-like lactoylglutathione lyase family enzyme